MTDRKFYKTIVQVEILSQEPIGPVDLETIGRQISEGDWSGYVHTISETVLDGKQAVEALAEQASDPSFFKLDEAGNESE